MKFSVIIPVYNVAPYLRECLDSVCVAAEKVKDEGEQWNVEVICVDDGSTDGSGAILDEYKEQLESAAGVGQRTVRSSTVRLHLSPSPSLGILHQPNRGVSAARNAALDIATGDWICFLDGDDLFSSDMLAAGAKLVRENPDCDIVRVGSATFVDGTGPRQIRPFRGGLLGGVFCTGFYRRAKFGDVRFPDYIVGEDRVYAARCVFRTGRIAESETIGYLYRQRTTSVSHVAMTARKAQDGFLHVAEMLKLAVASGRTLETGFRRMLVAQVLESGATNCGLLDRSGRREVWVRWFACVADLRERGLLTPWGTFVADVLRVLPFAPVVWTLCVLPLKLKRRGVHR